jgi:glycosyltransferase involved in cell wall biosynthesis
LILLVGRDDWRKGLGTLIAALRIVRKDFPGYPFRAEVIGDEYLHGRIMGKLYALGIKLKFRSGRSFEELIAEYQKALIIYLGSWQEGFGLSLAEGMAAGCVAIGSDAGGIPEVIADGKTGILFSSGEELELAAKIQALLENDEFRIQLAQRGQKFVRENFSMQKMRESLLNAYAEVLKLGR